MAASVFNAPLLRHFPRLSSIRSAYGVQVFLQTLCTETPPEDSSLPLFPVSPYKDEPWKYLDSEEYQTRYGSRPVWADYRRNHKGGIPPQRTRKTCIHFFFTGLGTSSPASFFSLQRKNKVAGNPCPICRDHKLHVDFRNVKLLGQFVCAHTGVIFHAPYTGDPWYPWYSWKQPRERELSRLRRLYQGHLQEESGPPPTSIPEVPLTTGAEASIEEAGPRSAL
ncbi:28S ribosomal protein S18b, mitochondrial isoform X4 [Rousettus aegyptiacus]|uniref:28S ribosomal protein S18b, mitochondrial isoform X4 n=1 Tax=Rousettus aegyptiacus TaxID=9407 RepID=UPI00168CD4E4|nr:28S ribosomal protein S18b, mitochondrial isoform X4 [Rousettus aegyptiacus]